MYTQTLRQNWTMRRHLHDADECVNAVVPGSVYNDLLVNKKMDDPFWRDNEDAAFSLMEHDFEYTTTFFIDRTILESEQIALRCNGLDSIADVYFNNVFLGQACNMHRVWEFDATPYVIKESGVRNSVRILFHSPNTFVREAYAAVRTDGSSDCLDGFPQLRKAHCMFGWDWGPRLPDAGIWRDIELLGVNKARIDGVYITQRHERGTVELALDIAVKSVAGDKSGRESGEEPLVYTVSVADPSGAGIFRDRASHNKRRVVVEQPWLWWPRAYGEQPLYTIKVALEANGEEIDSWERRIGLRTLTVRRERDAWGESFAFEANGVRIFAMGADYIPEDSILSRVTAGRTRTLLEQCAAANFNLIRVWGGGYYPDDFFFDACDELGLIVWQDFMFACAVYNLTDAFEENISAEFIDNIKRIRHHASLGLWCGNNEMEGFIQDDHWVSDPKQKADYIKLFEYILPKILKKYDPNAFYWPSSPSSGGSFDNPQDPSRGDAHYWDVWHGGKPFSDYRNYLFRFVSEFGFQSFPCLKTVESFTAPEDRNIFSYIMERHQRNASANGKIMGYLSQMFLYPTDFDILLYASQLLQAEAVTYGVEHFRRNRGRCMGAIYWQLNDCWPVASWASIDYFGKWKALHYFAKRFFAPLLISCEEQGLLTQDANVNAQPHKKAAMKKEFRLSVANETMEDRNVRVTWEIRDKNAVIVRENAVDMAAPALSSVWLDAVEVKDIALNDEYVSYHLEEQGVVVSEGSVIFSPPKYFHFVDPKLSCRIEGDAIVVKAEAYAKGVEIQNEKQDMILSDNYFDMDAGEKRVGIISGEPNGVKLRSVFDIR
ncbi:MAG: glycoside hydrolase family 2 protein [Treponema sp.]|jgi:beta-mannosidase|nr:glycoside hydrolase family 2 protein [Treponema sp.]